MLFEFDDLANQKAKLKVLGIGGGGGNAVNRMIESGLSGVDFIAINTDAQDLDLNLAPTKIQIGKEQTRGLGAGAVTNVGRSAIEADQQPVFNAINNADMIFITAGMGGGTGTGASPLIAKIAKEQGCLTVAIVTKPFYFEGPKRMERAEKGIEELRNYVDTLIVIPNQRLLTIVDRKTSVREAFKTADSILYQATKGISDLINHHGIINLDFADVRTIMKDAGDAMMGTGLAAGEERAVLAAQQAISSPLLDDMSIRGAHGLLINVTGGDDLKLHEVDEACQIITEEAGKDADIIFGAVVDENLKDEIMITVIATGFGGNGKAKTISYEEHREMDREEASVTKEIGLAHLQHNIREQLDLPIETETGGMKFEFQEVVESGPVFNHSEIPAFLRKKMNIK